MFESIVERLTPGICCQNFFLGKVHLYQMTSFKELFYCEGGMLTSFLCLKGLISFSRKLRKLEHELFMLNLPSWSRVPCVNSDCHSKHCRTHLQQSWGFLQYTQRERVLGRSVVFVDEEYGDYHDRCAMWCSGERTQAKSMIVEAGIFHTFGEW